MTSWLEQLKTITAHDWPGGLGADVETAVEKIEQLQAERDAYRKVAIAWFNHEGPCLSYLVNKDIAADVDKFAAQDVRAAEAGKART